MRGIYVVSDRIIDSKYYFNWFATRYEKYIAKKIKTKRMLRLSNDLIIEFITLNRLLPNQMKYSCRDKRFKDMCYLKEIENLNLLIKKMTDGNATMEDFKLAPQSRC